MFGSKLAALLIMWVCCSWKALFQAAVDAGVMVGVSPGTATTLAAEAVTSVIKEAEGKPISAEGWHKVKMEFCFSRVLVL